jgi:ubiquitin C-terminal hydrolase
LDDYLSIEHLQGENQYFCESCKARVDATRCIKLRTLPPVLNFQLKRCVFLAKVMLVTGRIGAGVMFQFENYFIIYACNGNECI